MQSMGEVSKRVDIPPDCCPKLVSTYLCCCCKCVPKGVKERWGYVRSCAHLVVEHRYFEWLIIFSIIISSTTLVSCSYFDEDD
jgi:hypothetical protein